MIKAKLVAAFSTIIAVLAFSAAPAFGEFASTNGTSHGAGKAGAIVLEGGGATLTCTSAEGEWKIANGTTKGPILVMTFSKLNECKAKTSELKEISAVVIKCALSFEQAVGSTKAKASTASLEDCEVKIKSFIFTCKITLPKGQTGLETNLLANSGSNMLITVAITGLTTKVEGTCQGAMSTHEGKLKTTITAVGLNEV